METLKARNECQPFSPRRFLLETRLARNMCKLPSRGGGVGWRRPHVMMLFQHEIQHRLSPEVHTTGGAVNCSYVNANLVIPSRSRQNLHRLLYMCQRGQAINLKADHGAPLIFFAEQATHEVRHPAPPHARHAVASRDRPQHVQIHAENAFYKKLAQATVSKTREDNILN